MEVLSTPKHDDYAYKRLMTENEKAISETNFDLLEVIMTQVSIESPLRIVQAASQRTRH